MGTAKKMDPTKLSITTLDKTNYDPLAKKIRKMVKEEKIKGKVMVVSSKEPPLETEEKKLGSNSFVPAAAGLLCASYVINDIVGDLNEIIK
jgi:tRNA A37 threonylcarbamoyladenosine dehydratase